MSDQNAAADTRFEIRTGALVVATDGEIGRIDGVVVSPETGAVEGLVIRAVMHLGRDLLIPVDAVADATEDLVRLRLTREDLAALPAYDRHNYTRPAPDWPFAARHRAANALVRGPGLPVRDGLRPGEPGQPIDLSDNVKLRPGQSVANADGEVGPLDLVLLDASTGKVSQLVVRHGGLLGRDTLVPAEWISAVDGNRIVVNATREQLERLPEYRSDDAITDAVQRILWYGSDLPTADVRYVNVRTVNGVVELRGYTGTKLGRVAIEGMVRDVAGVLDVRNSLRSFESLSEARRPTEQPVDPTARQTRVGAE